MKSTLHYLGIKYTTIYELTQTREPKTILNQKEIIGIFKPKPFKEEIKPMLINIKNLMIPKQWYLEDIAQSEEQKNFGGIEIHNSRNSLHIKNNSKQPLLTRNNSEGTTSFRESRIIKESVLSQLLGDHNPKIKDND